MLQSFPPTSLYAAAALTATQSTKKRIDLKSFFVKNIWLFHRFDWVYAYTQLRLYLRLYL